MNDTFPTLRAWLTSRTTRDLALHQLARALGVRPAAAEDLLQATPTAETLLNLNRLAQYRHLALAHRVWPHCTWLAWENRKAEPPVIDLIRRVLGRELLEYVERTFGRDRVLQYWRELEIPSHYDDISLGDEDGDPLEDLPEEQLVDNPHLDLEVEVGELFGFGYQATAACFRWLIDNRSNYSHYVDNRTSYTHDPLGVQLAYDLRRVLQAEYWAPLPPDTLPTYLALVRALQVATVPESYQAGALPLLYTSRVATLPTDVVHLVQVGEEDIWLHPADVLVFDGEPVHVFVLEPDTGEAPAALILTTHADPGNPEQHRAQPPARYLNHSDETEQLALVPRAQLATIRDNLQLAEAVVTEALWGENHALDADSGLFCVWRYNPGLPSSCYGHAIPVYRIPGGYMLQFDPEYCFSPQEMAVE